MHRVGFARRERFDRRDDPKLTRFTHVLPLQIFAARGFRDRVRAIAHKHRPMVETPNLAALDLAADKAIAGVEDRPADVGVGRLDHWCAMIDAASHATVASTANVNKHATTTRGVTALATIRRNRATDSRSPRDTCRASPRASDRAQGKSPKRAALVPPSSACPAPAAPPLARSKGRRSYRAHRAIALSLQSLP